MGLSGSILPAGFRRGTFWKSAPPALGLCETGSSMAEQSSMARRKPIRDALFLGDLRECESLALAGTACTQCDEVTLGVNQNCLNCGSEMGLETKALGRIGKLMSWTVIRHRPPGDYRGPEPFDPYGFGIVALPEGLAVVSPLSGAIDHFAIGDPFRFVASPLYVDADGDEVIAFRFEPAGEEL